MKGYLLFRNDYLTFDDDMIHHEEDYTVPCGWKLAFMVFLLQPPPQSTKNQVSVNGVAGGASGAAGGSTATACDPQPATDQQLPRTPRKSKSMGRIHGGGAGPEVEGAAGGPETAGGTQQQGGNQEGQHDQAPSRPDAAAPTQHWHRGHRRTPSDGVAWRHSKGTHGHMHT